MSLELIPVLEIGCSDQEIGIPSDMNPEMWEQYYNEYHKKAGLKPYKKGLFFYKLSDVSGENLTKLILDHTHAMREGIFERGQMCSFFGGYVLRVGQQDEFFPQCCGELSDIWYWERIAMEENSYCEGHPAPQVSFKEGKITFDFSVGELDELFQPNPPRLKLCVDGKELKKAVEVAKKELKSFGQRLNKINEEKGFNIENIEGLLIWDNANYE